MKLNEHKTGETFQQSNSIGNSAYINIDFILGSAVEVERLWNMASHVLFKK